MVGQRKIVACRRLTGHGGGAGERPGGGVGSFRAKNQSG